MDAIIDNETVLHPSAFCTYSVVGTRTSWNHCLLCCRLYSTVQVYDLREPCDPTGFQNTVLRFSTSNADCVHTRNEAKMYTTESQTRITTVTGISHCICEKKKTFPSLLFDTFVFPHFSPGQKRDVLLSTDSNQSNELRLHSKAYWHNFLCLRFHLQRDSK